MHTRVQSREKDGDLRQVARSESESNNGIGTHLLEDDPSIELASSDQLIDKIQHVHHVNILIDVARDENGAVDSFCRDCSPDIDFRAVLVIIHAPVWVVVSPLAVKLKRK